MEHVPSLIPINESIYASVERITNNTADIVVSSHAAKYIILDENVSIFNLVLDGSVIEFLKYPDTTHLEVSLNDLDVNLSTDKVQLGGYIYITSKSKQAIRVAFISAFPSVIGVSNYDLDLTKAVPSSFSVEPDVDDSININYSASDKSGNVKLYTSTTFLNKEVNVSCFQDNITSDEYLSLDTHGNTHTINVNVNNALQAGAWTGHTGIELFCTVNGGIDSHLNVNVRYKDTHINKTFSINSTNECDLLKIGDIVAYVVDDQVVISDSWTLDSIEPVSFISGNDSASIALPDFLDEEDINDYNPQTGIVSNNALPFNIGDTIGSDELIDIEYVENVYPHHTDTELLQEVRSSNIWYDINSATQRGYTVLRYVVPATARDLTLELNVYQLSNDVVDKQSKVQEYECCNWVFVRDESGDMVYASDFCIDNTLGSTRRASLNYTFNKTSSNTEVYTIEIYGINAVDKSQGEISVRLAEQRYGIISTNTTQADYTTDSNGYPLLRSAKPIGTTYSNQYPYYIWNKSRETWQLTLSTNSPATMNPVTGEIEPPDLHPDMMGVYNITTNQYVEFLNNVASNTDTYKLWDARMSIDRSINSLTKEYVYTSRSGTGYLPVTWISIFEACRFCNWLHNNKPKGTQTEATTEHGSYTLTTRGIPHYLTYCSTRKRYRVTPPALNKDTCTWYLPLPGTWFKLAFYAQFSPVIPTVADSFWGTLPGELLGMKTPQVSNLTNQIYNYGTGRLLPVGTAPKGPDSIYGFFDLLGNVREYVYDSSSSYKINCTGTNYQSITATTDFWQKHVTIYNDLSRKKQIDKSVSYDIDAEFVYTRGFDYKIDSPYAREVPVRDRFAGAPFNNRTAYAQADIPSRTHALNKTDYTGFRVAKKTIRTPLAPTPTQRVVSVTPVPTNTPTRANSKLLPTPTPTKTSTPKPTPTSKTPTNSTRCYSFIYSVSGVQVNDPTSSTWNAPTLLNRFMVGTPPYMYTTIYTKALEVGQEIYALNAQNKPVGLSLNTFIVPVQGDERNISHRFIGKVVVEVESAYSSTQKRVVSHIKKVHDNLGVIGCQLNSCRVIVDLPNEKGVMLQSYKTGSIFLNNLQPGVTDSSTGIFVPVFYFNYKGVTYALNMETGCTGDVARSGSTSTTTCNILKYGLRWVFSQAGTSQLYDPSSLLRRRSVAATLTVNNVKKGTSSITQVVDPLYYTRSLPIAGNVNLVDSKDLMLNPWMQPGIRVVPSYGSVAANSGVIGNNSVTTLVADGSNTAANADVTIRTISTKGSQLVTTPVTISDDDTGHVNQNIQHRIDFGDRYNSLKSVASVDIKSTLTPSTPIFIPVRFQASTSSDSDSIQKGGYTISMAGKLIESVYLPDITTFAKTTYIVIPFSEYTGDEQLDITLLAGENGGDWNHTTHSITFDKPSVYASMGSVANVTSRVVVTEDRVLLNGLNTQDEYILTATTITPETFTTGVLEPIFTDGTRVLRCVLDNTASIKQYKWEYLYIKDELTWKSDGVVAESNISFLEQTLPYSLSCTGEAYHVYTVTQPDINTTSVNKDEQSTLTNISVCDALVTISTQPSYGFNVAVDVNIPDAVYGADQYNGSGGSWNGIYCSTVGNAQSLKSIFGTTATPASAIFTIVEQELVSDFNVNIGSDLTNICYIQVFDKVNYTPDQLVHIVVSYADLYVGSPFKITINGIEYGAINKDDSVFVLPSGISKDNTFTISKGMYPTPTPTPTLPSVELVAQNIPTTHTTELPVIDGSYVFNNGVQPTPTPTPTMTPAVTFNARITGPGYLYNGSLVPPLRLPGTYTQVTTNVRYDMQRLYAGQREDGMFACFTFPEESPAVLPFKVYGQQVNNVCFWKLTLQGTLLSTLTASTPTSLSVLPFQVNPVLVLPYGQGVAHSNGYIEFNVIATQPPALPTATPTATPTVTPTATRVRPGITPKPTRTPTRTPTCTPTRASIPPVRYSVSTYAGNYNIKSRADGVATKGAAFADIGKLFGINQNLYVLDARIGAQVAIRQINYGPTANIVYTLPSLVALNIQDITTVSNSKKTIAYALNPVAQRIEFLKIQTPIGYAQTHVNYTTITGKPVNRFSRITAADGPLINTVDLILLEPTDNSLWGVSLNSSLRIMFLKKLLTLSLPSNSVSDIHCVDNGGGSNQYTLYYTTRNTRSNPTVQHALYSVPVSRGFAWIGTPSLVVDGGNYAVTSLGADQFKMPGSIASYGSNVYFTVADGGVIKHSSGSTIAGGLSSVPPKTGYIDSVNGLDAGFSVNITDMYGSNSALYVADTSNNVIRRVQL